MKLFWWAIYCANPKPKPNSRSVSLSRRGIGRRSPWVIWDYYLATATSILPLIHPRTCKMGSSIFAAMIWLKLGRKDRASFLSVPSTDIKNRVKCSCCSCQWLPCLSFFSFPHISSCVTIVPSCRCHSLGPPVWRQIWHQSYFPIILWWGRHLVSLSRPSPDKPPPMVCYGPGRLVVRRIHS